MNRRSLHASINGTLVGTLAETNNLWSFQYVSAWINNPKAFALSPHLPLASNRQLDGASTRPVQWYFDNLLPEEGQRVLLAADAKISISDAFGLLEWYGAESAGSLTLHAPGFMPDAAQASRVLTNQALELRIKQLPTIPLTHGAIKRMSLAGAQHKLAIIMQDGVLLEPVGATASTHILKPDHPNLDYSHSVINEWFVMRLAQRMGLVVPDVDRRYMPSPIYIIDRFDRELNPNGWTRRHAIDACQLLGLDRSFKYSQGSTKTLGKLANACRSPAVARTRLFEWLVFNVLVGNADAHLKNLSFVVSTEGIELAPFYDLLSTASYESVAFDKQGWPTQTQLAWPILGVSHFHQVNRNLLLQAAAELNLSSVTAQRLLDNLRKRIMQQAAKLNTEFELANAILLRARPELSATFAGESRCLRVIEHTIIKDMVFRVA